jgi:tetratricopeptide (TPR) repeat protein
VLKDCEAVLTVRQDSSTAYVERAIATYRLSDRDAQNLAPNDPVVRDLKHALDLAPTDWEAMNWISDLTARSIPEEAVEWRKKLDRIYPGNGSNLYKLAQLQNDLGRFSEAYDTIQRAIAISPTNFRYYDLRDETRTRLGYSQVQVRRDRAQADRFVAELLRQRGNENAPNWESAAWRLLTQAAKSSPAVELGCNSEVSDCRITRVIYENSEVVKFSISEVNEDSQETRIVEINNGENSGIVVGSTGVVYASYKSGQERSRTQIGVAEVVSVRPQSSSLRVKLAKPEGEYDVREGDVVQLVILTPEIERRSPLWSIVKNDIAFLDQDENVIVDFDTLYSHESPELIQFIYRKMVDDIRSYGQIEGDSLRDKRVLAREPGTKPMTMDEVLVSTEVENLIRFLQYFETLSGFAYGNDWRIGVLYEWWIERGMPES